MHLYFLMALYDSLHPQVLFTYQDSLVSYANISRSVFFHSSRHLDLCKWSRV